jgi:hypothetical protein
MAWGQPQQHRYAVLRGVLCAATPSLQQTLRLWPHCLVALRRGGSDTNRKVEEQAHLR